MNLYKKLGKIQHKLKAPKGQYNSFGKYKYRSCEDILEGVKPLLAEHGCVLSMSDCLEMIGERYYIKALVSLVDCETAEQITVSAYAREEASKKGMDGSQVTGASSSYARKYALNGMFCIDDTKDSDTINNGKDDAEKKKYKCCDCGKAFKGVVKGDKEWTAEQIYRTVQKKSKDGKARCSVCLDKYLKEQEEKENAE